MVMNTFLNIPAALGKRYNLCNIQSLFYILIKQKIKKRLFLFFLM